MSEQILKEILGELKTLNQKVGSLETGQQRLETRMESLEKGQLRLETRMESEVIEKIGALFDGYTMRGDQIENLQKHLDQRLDSIEIDTGYLVSRVTRLENITK